MRVARYIGAGLAVLGIVVTAAAPAPARPARPHRSVHLAQIRYQAPPETGPNGEYVKLTNGRNYYINLRNWSLTERDDARRYTFPDKWLAPGGSVWLYSGWGRDAGANLFWRSRTYVWHNNDAAVLRNGRNTFVDACAWRGPGRGFTNCRP